MYQQIDHNFHHWAWYMGHTSMCQFHTGVVTFFYSWVTVENDGFSIWYLRCLLFNWCPSISSKFFLVSIHPSKVFWTFKLVSSKNVPDFLVNFIKKVLMPEFSYQLALQIFRGDSFYFPYTLIWREHQLKWTLTMLYLQVANQYGQWCCHFSGEWSMFIFTPPSQPGDKRSAVNKRTIVIETI